MPDGFDSHIAQLKPSTVTSVSGIVNVTTACWSVDIGEGGLGDTSFRQGQK